MVCMGFKPGAAEWKAQTNPLDYGGKPSFCLLLVETSLTGNVVVHGLSRFKENNIFLSLTNRCRLFCQA